MGRESPVPLPDQHSTRQYFHSRGDTSASQSSSYSLSASSTAVASQGAVPKKPSFANIRNPFAKTKPGQQSSLDATPTLPDAYPALRNPFARSASALSHATQPSERPTLSRHGTSSAKSSFSRPTLDTVAGSPLRQAPTAGTRLRDDALPSEADEDEAAVNAEPRAPTEFALRALFTDFVQIADTKLDEFLKAPLEANGEPSLNKMLGPGAHPPFDRTLASLAQLAQKHAAKVVESVSRWKKTHNDPVNPDITKHHTSQTSVDARIMRTSDVKGILSERKSVAAEYILCRALIIVLGSVPPNGLGERLGAHLEQLTFNQYEMSSKLLHPTINQRANAQLYGKLLAQMSLIRFVSLTDRFIAELAPIANGQVPKEAEPKFEHIVMGLKHIQMKAWPPEVFEEAAEFMEQLAKCYVNVHGSRLRLVFAEALLQLLHPIGKTAQAEVNHPMWARALEGIYIKTKEMMAKRQYWTIAYPLLVVSLCVAPRDFFLQNWSYVFELGAAKLKERTGRLLILNALTRLLWVYIYRCAEPTSSVLVKLATLIKYIFPPSRTNSGWAPDDRNQLDVLVYIVHYILLRHSEYGQELVLGLLQEPSNSASTTFQLSDPERVVVGIRAVLVTLHAMEKDVTTPVWPSSWDLNSPIPATDYPASADRLLDDFWEQPQRAGTGAADFFRTRCARHIETLALSLGARLARCHYFDAQFALARLGDSAEERDAFVVREHREDGRGVHVTYPKTLVQEIYIVQACLDALPRCLGAPGSGKLDQLLEIALESVVNVEPSLGAAAGKALLRLANDKAFSNRTAQHATRFLFGHSQVLNGPAEVFLMVEQEPLLKLWLAVVEAWTKVVFGGQSKAEGEEEEKGPGEEVFAVLREVQAAAIFLAAYAGPALRSAGATVLRLLRSLSVPLLPEDRAFDMFFGKEGLAILNDPLVSSLLEAQFRARHSHWKKQKHDDILLRVIESTNAVDPTLWVNIEALLFQRSWDRHPRIARHCRGTVLAAVLRYHPVVASSAGLKSTATPGSSRAYAAKERDAVVVDQWSVWIRLLCCTAFDGQSSGGRPPPETGAGSLESQWERISSARGLFWHLISFLAAETGNGRHAVIFALGSVPAIAVQGLLEDLQRITQYIFDGKAPRMSRSDRLHYAVAHVHNLVADHLPDPVVSQGPAMQLLVQFVRDTEAFLRRPDIMRQYDMQKLRKHFCSIVEKLFNQPEALQSPGLPNPLSIYSLCDEWCQYGPRSNDARARYAAMSEAAVAKWADKERETAAQRFHNESVHLSVAASGACTALCQVVIDYILNPPPADFGRNGPSAQPEMPELSGMLERFLAMLSSSSANVQAYGRRGVHTLLTALPPGHFLGEDAAHRAFVSSQNADATDSRFFAILEQVVTGGEPHPLSFEQLVATGLANLSNSQLAVRKGALRVLEHALGSASEGSSLRHLAASVCSAAPSVYLASVQRVSARIAAEHATSAGGMIAEITGLLLDTGADQHIHGVLLQSLRPWIASVELLPDGFATITQDGARVILHLLALTSRYYATYCEELRDLWAAVVDDRQPLNGSVMIQFLIDLLTARDNPKLTAEAVRAVACLSNSDAGSRAIQDLCDFINPRSMLPPHENIIIPPSILDPLFPRSTSRSGLARGQVAFVLLSDLAVERAWELRRQLPITLHILFIHLEHKTSYLRDHALRLLLHTVRSWMPAYEELSNRSPRPAVDEAYDRIEEMQGQGPDAFKVSSRDANDGKFSQLLDDVLTVLEPLHPTLRQDWGELAVLWGTSCAIRPLAFAALKIFRLMMPSVNANMMGAVIGRLSNTVSDPDDHIQAFTVEILRTMTSLLESSELDMNLVPQLFWCTLACLSTTVEEEYVQALAMTKALLAKIDLNDEDNILYLEETRPETWSSASADLQSSVLVGLRSSVTSASSWELLQQIVQLDGANFIGSPTGRVRDAFAVCIPWCLQAMDDKTTDSMADFAMNLSGLAERSGYPSIQRVMVSFAKQRFRTRDDFLRQALSSLREHFAATMADTCTLLLGLVLNSTRWLQLRSMEVLKVLFTHRETWNPIRLAGSELLMPLLRLLPTDMSSQALDVLDQPIAVFGGPSAAQVVRMSMQNVKPNIFGPPQESGWSIAKPDQARTLTRMNLLAVFETCKVLDMPPSSLVFEQEDTIASPVSLRSQRQFGSSTSVSSPTARNTVYGISELLSNLHALTSYFADEGPSHEAESKVNAILAPRGDRTHRTTDTARWALLHLLLVRERTDPTRAGRGVLPRL
ncbi:hypothetical protein EXIGLDRAFT_698301 [Exidia glandulosa HHB12029]|uniref:ARM repeat-containing protein n=1 Tax=Exidia glandulosa HHB12029 TaxID=1314781 RepID=A0A165MQA1_EXIGL|nr:hypothetical protein EXIGLDRAFT_698301 [Exidia glandulosa HHB12029]